MKKTLSILTMALISAQAMANDNWTSTDGTPIHSGTGLCVRDSSWTPATAHPDCDGAVKKVTTVVVPVTEQTKSVATKVTYQSDTLFDFDRSTLKPAGKQVLDQLVAKISNLNLEVVVAVGHTDNVGTAAYNIKLGQRRAEAVKAYLISRGVDRARIFTDSKGLGQPVASNKTADGRAKNRRVEIEVIGVTR